MNISRIIGTVFAMGGLLTASAVVTVYPAGKDIPLSEAYSVSVRQAGSDKWLPVDIYPVKLQHMRFENGKVSNSVEKASMCYFDFDGSVEVRVISNSLRVKSARVRPLSYGIAPAISGDTLTFSLDRPRNLSIEVNGDLFRNLHLFANPIDTHRPTPKQIRKDKNLMYFAPGVHKFPGDSLNIPSNTTVYVDGGALVQARLITDGTHDVKFYGRGMIMPEPRGEGVYIKRAKNIEADGIIVTQIPVGGSDSVTVTNVKSLSSYGWGDGMNVFASNNVTYRDCFCRNSDDCSTVYATRKGFRGGCDNILMENSTLWADVAHPIMIGLHGSATEIGLDAPADTIQNVTYRNLDILDHQEMQKDYQGVFGISCGDNNIVRDILFDNIRVEDFRRGQLINIRVVSNDKYCKAPGGGVHGVTFRDVCYNGNNASTSIIAGYDANREVTGLTFENLTVNGMKITDKMPGKPGWYKPWDMCDIFVGEHVKHITFK